MFRFAYARRMLFALSLVAASAANASAATPTNDVKNNDTAIRATADAFVAAFNRGNAAEVAALWTVDGTLTDEQGELIKGRAAIEAKYAALFKQYPGLKIEVAVKSIEFPTSTIAIEDGTTQVFSENSALPSAASYTAVHALDGGKWLMASVRESSAEPASSSEQLQQLGCLVGEWQAKVNDTTFHSEFNWIANKSYLQRDYETSRDGEVVATGTQIIGWNPKTAQIQSWSFDSSGGHGIGYWQSVTGGWRIQSFGVRGDGTQTSSIDCLIRVAGENDVFGWRSLDRRAGNVALPYTPEIVFDRLSNEHGDK